MSPCPDAWQLLRRSRRWCRFIRRPGRINSRWSGLRRRRRVARRHRFARRHRLGRRHRVGGRRHRRRLLRRRRCHAIVSVRILFRAACSQRKQRSTKINRRTHHGLLYLHTVPRNLGPCPLFLTAVLVEERFGISDESELTADSSGIPPQRNRAQGKNLENEPESRTKKGPDALAGAGPHQPRCGMSYTRSMIIAMPCPTPMHMVHSA